MKNVRNTGIDFLRIVAMFFVVVLHTNNFGGFLFSTSIDSIQYKLGWLIEIVSLCAVDVFAIISGYVMWNKKTNYPKLINLWLQVVFYSLTITVIINFMYPEIITKSDYIKCFFPIINNTYWYFTAYFGLFLIKPFIDTAIQNMNEEKLKKLFILNVVVFSIIGLVAKGFVLNKGYSIIWLIVLYIIGAIISKCKIGSKIGGIKIFWGIIILILITYLVKIFGSETINVIKNNFDIIINKDILTSYISPTIFGISILLIVGIQKIRFNKLSKKIIEFAAASSFAIYLLNSHYLFTTYIYKGKFTYLTSSGVLTIVKDILLFSLLFVIVSILIDKIRIFIFKFLRINELCELTYSKTEKIVSKIAKIM